MHGIVSTEPFLWEIEIPEGDIRGAHTLFSAAATPLGKGSSCNFMEIPPSLAAGSLGSYTVGPTPHYWTHSVTAG